MALCKLRKKGHLFEFGGRLTVFDNTFNPVDISKTNYGSTPMEVKESTTVESVTPWE